MPDNIRDLMERWAHWRHYKHGGYGKTLTQKCIEGMPGTNCPTCQGRGRASGARIARKQSHVICPDCGGTGRVKLEDKTSAPRVRSCPGGCGKNGDKQGEINGRTCHRCRGAGSIIETKVKVNPAFILPTRYGTGDPTSERIDRLVCELRQRDATLSYYFVIWAEYCDGCGGTHQMKAQRLFLTCACFEKRLERAFSWIESAMPDLRQCRVIPFPYRKEKTSV